MKDTNKKVLCIHAHPDDIEILCAGTLVLLKQQGWTVYMATMTPGQAGSLTLNANEISKVRRMEAEKSAKIIGATYHCLECEDIFILYDRKTITKGIKLVREIRPDLVITASPSDYIVDHEITSKVVQTACLAATIPNIVIEGTTPTLKVPFLYYSEPAQGIDKFGIKIESSILVDIESTIDIKSEMLECHESQNEWLKNISKVNHLVENMKVYSRKVGAKIGLLYAEGFRQHLGFSYPSDNIIQSELEKYVYTNPELKNEV